LRLSYARTVEDWYGSSRHHEESGEVVLGRVGKLRRELFHLGVDGLEAGGWFDVTS
jgi:hypothetical protein